MILDISIYFCLLQSVIFISDYLNKGIHDREKKHLSSIS